MTGMELDGVAWVRLVSCPTNVFYPKNYTVIQKKVFQHLKKQTRRRCPRGSLLTRSEGGRSQSAAIGVLAQDVFHRINDTVIQKRVSPQPDRERPLTCQARNTRGLPLSVSAYPIGFWSAWTAIFDWTQTRTGLTSSRNAAMREALAGWLAERERDRGVLSAARSGEPRARSRDAQRFYEAYRAIGQGRDFVRIHRIREALGWPREDFDGLLDTLAAAYHIELHGGNPGSLSPEQLEGSYRDAHGRLYLTVSWRGE